MTPSQSDPRLQLQPVSAHTRVWWLILCVVLPVAITAIALTIASNSDDPRRLVGDSVSLTVLLGIGGVAVLTLAIWWVIDRSLRRHRLSLDSRGLEIATTFYRRRLALDELQLKHARVVDLAEHTELRPRLKTNGVDLPGFKSGWFRLRNGRKALVARADGDRVLWIPTTRDFDLLLQPRQPQALLDTLRRMATGADDR